MGDNEGLASFFLVPRGSKAEKVVMHDRNQRLRVDYKDARALNIVLSGEYPVVSLGRDKDVDIYLPDHEGADISRRHCFFILEVDSGAVVLHDQSSKHNTDVLDRDEDHLVPISKASHSVIVCKRLNRRITLGTKRYYQFDLEWQSETIDEELAAWPTELGPRGSPEFRYIRGEEVGQGAFGTVHKAVNVRDGKAIAVKRLGGLEGRKRLFAQREVVNLLRIGKGTIHNVGVIRDSKLIVLSLTVLSRIIFLKSSTTSSTRRNKSGWKSSCHSKKAP